MSRQVARAVVLTLLALLTGAATASVTTMVEPRLVEEMDTIWLTIRLEGAAPTGGPELEPLLEDFEVVSNQTSSRLTSINGRTTASVDYKIALRPRRTGELTIPSLSIGTEHSEAVNVVVRALDPQLLRAIESMVFFETELSTNPVYVQAETVLTRRLFYSQGVQIYSDLPGEPAVQDAVVIPLGETQSRSVLRGGQRYGVIEQRFALFPERSGTVEIPAISVTSSVSLPSAGRRRRSGVRVTADALSVEVLPIPASYPADAAWLPARDVRLELTWQPPRASVEVGEPLGLSYRAIVQGNRGSAIPPLPLPLPEDRFKIYPEAPGIDESSDQGTVIGRRREVYALLPTTPGRVRLPPLTLSWWDTASDRLRTARIDVAPLVITGSPAATPAAPPGDSASAAEPEAADVSGTASAPVPLRVIGYSAGALLLATLAIVALLRAWPRRRSNLFPFVARLHRPSKRGRRRALEKQLRQAARAADNATFRTLLGEYLATGSGELPGAALTDFHRDEQALTLCQALDATLYSTGAEPLTSAQLHDLLTLAKQVVERRRRKPKSEPLPALYG